ncbi:MAG: hypothetical protein ACTHNP_05895 [Solirubrobacterales bacterium]
MRGRAATHTKRLRDNLDRSLFLPTPPATLRVRGWEGAAVVASFLALGAALQFFRIGPSSAINSLWAEDGPVFLGGALTHGFIDNVTTPYAEYLVVIQRLFGEVGAAVPLHDAPLAMNLAAVLFVSLCGLAVWVASAAHIRSPYLRALLVALTILCPVSSIEAVVSATNASWYGAFACFWLLLWRPARTWGACLGGLLILITGLSTPALFFFVPLAALRAIAIRDRRDALIVGAFALALAVQLPVTALSDEHLVNPAFTVNALTTFLQRVVNGSVLGLELGGSLWADLGWPFLIALTVALTAYLIALALRASRGRLFAAVAVVTAVGMFLVSAYERALGDAMVWPEGFHNSNGGRYAIVPVLLLISAAFALLDSRLRRGKGRPVMAVATAAVLLVALVTSFDVSVGAGRGGPQWGDSLDQAAAACRAEHLSEATVFVAPAGWGMPISCDRLESATGSAPAG